MLFRSSYSFITQKYELEKNMVRAIGTAKQITAIVLYNPNEYIKQSWQVIKDKANLARITFEDLMQPGPTAQ